VGGSYRPAHPLLFKGRGNGGERRVPPPVAGAPPSLLAAGDVAADKIYSPDLSDVLKHVSFISFLADKIK